MLFAGSGALAASFQGDGTTRASANLPPMTSLAFEPGGNLLVATGGSSYVYIICTATGGVHCTAANTQDTVYRLIGNGSTTGLASSSGDISGSLASSVGKPGPLVTDTNGNVFVYDIQNNKVYLACFNTNGACGGGRSSGTLYHVAGTGIVDDGTDGTATNVAIGKISQMARLPDGNLVLADHGANRIRLLCLNDTGNCSGSTAGSLYRWAGSGGSDTNLGDNTTKNSVDLGKPSGIAVTNSGDVLVQTALNPRIWVICNQTAYAPCSNSRALGHAYWLAGTGAGGNGPSNTWALGTPIGPLAPADAEFEFGRLAIDPWSGHVYSNDGDARAVRLFTGLGR